MTYSFDDITNQIVLRVLDVINQKPQLRPGIVTSYDPGTHCVKVQWQPDQTLSGWLPLNAISAGNGWGIWAPPAMGSEVMVDHLQGDANSGVVVAVKHNLVNPVGTTTNAIGGTAVGPQQGEIVLVNQTGAVIRLCQDGSVYIKAANINIDGQLTVSGNIIGKMDVSDKHGSVDRLRGHYNSHAHTGIQTGSGTSAVTNTLDPE